ncbi:GNAT family N-acetyltransferase [Bacillus sp. AGMB 02131]|uniref:GNAT family N-acetyltransferase n=1 Tax=Peribacillus faecalis TaxID=2772559 RepID=A0A927HAH0_9BACI|nr:GNAT family N-acetyltransferase [Peribacillus faecalis]MBD3107542.1 GNAT family N-acetyltransferase [Peribacillus faecalis]
MSYQLISDYKHNETYKRSFNELAKRVFGIDFKQWYEKGCWNDNYICYSYVAGEKVIANASINKMTIVQNGSEFKAIQIGTVMTHPDYRNQGLSGKLMEHIIAKYEQDYDFIYLFANETVLDFYPKFGFETMQESNFSLSISDLKRQPSALRQLHADNPEDFELMKKFAEKRVPVSSRLGVKNNEHLLMFYLILVFADDIFYIEEEEAIVIFTQAEGELHLFDVISKSKTDLRAVLRRIAADETEIVHFYFIPDDELEGVSVEKKTERNDTLFVRPLWKGMSEPVLFPLTSHA